jgi:hypothetical protein
MGSESVKKAQTVYKPSRSVHEWLSETGSILE